MIADLNVEVMLVETETVVLLPARRVAEIMEVAKLNVAGTVTTRFTAAVLVVDPDTAVMVSG